MNCQLRSIEAGISRTHQKKIGDSMEQPLQPLSHQTADGSMPVVMGIVEIVTLTLAITLQDNANDRFQIIMPVSSNISVVSRTLLIHNYLSTEMNDGKSVTLPLFETHVAQAIPQVKRRIIIHDTSESEDDTMDLPTRKSPGAHIIDNGNVDGQHQGMSLSGDPINTSMQHAQMALPPLTTTGTSCTCTHE